MTDPEALAALRRDLARLLSGLFLGPPTNAQVATLADPDAREVLTSLLGEGARAHLAALADPPSESVLRETFFALLAVPGWRYKPPFEAVYCDARELDEGSVGGLLLGESTQAVGDAYAREGFALGVPELPDHLGCELAFLAALSEREREALERSDSAGAWRAVDAAAAFAREHPLRWFGAFAGRLATDPEGRWYHHLASLAEALARASAARGALLPLRRRR
ncbi:MAG: molecular chaperone TorD family protein [Deltaproteobacteria bacterium]|nr:molecular chaperone TorD family protein [Deltaproteobacteria bacterium]